MVGFSLIEYLSKRDFRITAFAALDLSCDSQFSNFLSSIHSHARMVTFQDEATEYSARSASRGS